VTNVDLQGENKHRCQNKHCAAFVGSIGYAFNAAAMTFWEDRGIWCLTVNFRGLFAAEKCVAVLVAVQDAFR
jgi:hypothetical protein